MSSNLPPGVSDMMIPGNEPEPNPGPSRKDREWMCERATGYKRLPRSKKQTDDSKSAGNNE